MQQKRMAQRIANGLALLGVLGAAPAAPAQTAPPAASASPAASSPPAITLPPLDLASGFVVPFRYDPPLMPFIIVQARVNGEGPYPFMVDTGSSFTLIINKTFVPRLNLHNNHQRSVLNGTIKAGNVDVQTFQVTTSDAKTPLTFNFTQGAASAAAVDMGAIRQAYAGPEIAGVIGAPILAALTERIDFARREMTFYEPAHAPLHLPDAACLPVQDKNSRYFVDIGAEDGVTTPLLLDTGSLLTTLPLSFRPHLHPAATTLDGHEMLGSFTLGSEWLLPSLRVGTLAEPDVEATVDKEGGVLGLNVLTRFTVFIDFRNHQLLLQRASDYAARQRLSGYVGMRLTQPGRVIDLRSASPAACAGVHLGDQVLTVDERTVAGLNDYVAQKLVDGQAGTPLTLTLQRAGEPVQTVVVARVRQFDAPPTVLDGLMLYKSDKPYLEVQDVAPGSLAAIAQIQTGDRILKINTLNAKAITTTILGDQIRLPSMRLQVLGVKDKRPHDVLLALPAAP